MWLNTRSHNLNIRPWLQKPKEKIITRLFHSFFQCRKYSTNPSFRTTNSLAVAFYSADQGRLSPVEDSVHLKIAAQAGIHE
jgi:hypothetical protein